jgi:hypothetical protein
MTDTPPVPPTPETPATPAAAGVPAGAPAAGPKQTLSLIGFIAGIAAFVLSWVFVLGFLVSVAAIVLSLMGKSREPGAPKWMWIVGLIGGIIGLLGSLIWGALTIVGLIASTTYSTY